MNIYQKLVELRKQVPHISKEKHSNEVKYKFAKIDNIWSAITPKMNELGITFEVVKESDSTLEPYMRPTKYGDLLMWIYRANMKIKWTNAENAEDFIESDIHAVAWNDDPAKAKGAAWTYALKYYLFENFSIDMGEEDPDMKGNKQKEELKKPNDEMLITRAQKEQIFKLAKGNADICKATLTKFGYEDSSQIRVEDYAKICAEVSKAAKASESNGNY